MTVDTPAPAPADPPAMHHEAAPLLVDHGHNHHHDHGHHHHHPSSPNHGPDAGERPAPPPYDETTLAPHVQPLKYNARTGEWENMNDQKSHANAVIYAFLYGVSMIMAFIVLVIVLNIALPFTPDPWSGKWSFRDMFNGIMPCHGTTKDGHHSYKPQWTVGNIETEGSKKVALEAHIMSKCPDAADCIHDLVLPAMAEISHKVDFKLSFIGVNGLDKSVTCMHGPSECLGNMVMLCAAREYPEPEQYLGYSNCLLEQYSHIPEKPLLQQCSLEHGLDFDKISNCASTDDAANGMALLRDSVQRSVNAGIMTSCTVRLEKEVRCIRDGGEWKHCSRGSKVSDLVRDINERFEELNAGSSEPDVEH